MQNYSRQDVIAGSTRILTLRVGDCLAATETGAGASCRSRKGQAQGTQTAPVQLLLVSCSRLLPLLLSFGILRRGNMIYFKRRIILTSSLILLLLCQLACSSNDNAHTTATTLVQPPPRQVLTVVGGNPYARVLPSPCETESPTKPAECVGVDPKKPLLVFDLPNLKSFRLGEVVSINFSVRNAKLRANGGDFRVRYIIDDEDAQWIDSDQPFGLSGWVPGKHTIRLELIGADGWPYRNGNQNIVTRELSVESN